MKLCHSKNYSSDGLTCPYHGKKNATQQELIHKWNYLWISEPDDFFSEVPVDFSFAGSGDVLLNAPFHVVVDNFNEGSHTPFVHRFTGPEISDLSQVSFSWKSIKDFVHIFYKTNQKKNFLFYGFSRKRQIDWEIDWKTYVKPLYMRYFSTWTQKENKKQLLEKNMTFFFLTPVGKNKTRIHFFVFIKPLTWMKHFPFIVKKISLFMTKNQIMEDQHFYKKIADLPDNLNNLKLDVYDQPLIEIRRRAKNLYSDFL